MDKGNHLFDPQILDRAREEITQTLRRCDSAMQFAVLTDLLSDFLAAQPPQAIQLITKSFATQLSEQVGMKLKGKRRPAGPVVDAAALRLEEQPADHELKSWPAYFHDMSDLRKTFDARFNDRGFGAGQIVLYKEWLPNDPAEMHGEGSYSGRRLRRRIIYVLNPTPGSDPDCGLVAGYVVLGLEPA